MFNLHTPSGDQANVTMCSQTESSCMSSIQAKSKEEWKSAESIYDFSVKDIDGNEVSLEKYRNQVVLIVPVFFSLMSLIRWLQGVAMTTRV